MHTTFINGPNICCLINKSDRGGYKIRSRLYDQISHTKKTQNKTKLKTNSKTNKPKKSCGMLGQCFSLLAIIVSIKSVVVSTVEKMNIPN